MKSVGVLTLGCKVNTYESEFVINELKNNGYIIKDFNDICDVYIINTCTVTNSSDSKSKKMIRQAIKRNPNACVVAMGCFIAANMDYTCDGLDIIIGNKDKSKIVELLDEYFKNKDIINKLIDIGVYSEIELNSRYDILLENYIKTIQVEALTALRMTKNEIYPACINYLNTVATTCNNVKFHNEFLIEEVKELSGLIAIMHERINKLETEVEKAQSILDLKEKALSFRDNVLTSMNSLRKVVDVLELKVDSKVWPLPTYIDLLFGI